MDLLFKKTGFPEVGELVMCEVAKVHYNGVFVNIMEYDKQGFIHISEVSPGRIRNINDYVKERKVIVCKVLRISMERNQIDLSLRRVNEAQKRYKSEQIKQEQKAEKIIEWTAKELKLDFKPLYAQIFSKLSKGNYLHEIFNEYLENKKCLDAYDLPQNVKAKLYEVFAIRIKPPVVEISGTITIKTYRSDGVNTIKESFAKAKKATAEVETAYEGAGKYLLRVKSRDFKNAEKSIRSFSDEVIASMTKSDKECIAEFTKNEPKK